MKFPLINESPEFLTDLSNITNFTPLNGVIFPVLTIDSHKVKTASYNVGSVLVKPETKKFVGSTFTADVNTYFHSNGSSICFVENIEWIDQPTWLNEDLATQVIDDAVNRGLTMKESYCPIFMIVSNRKTTLWGTHRDGDLYRIHHVLTSGDSRIVFYKDNTEVEYKYESGHSYVFDVSVPHNVFSYDDALRLNIVIDCLHP